MKYTAWDANYYDSKSRLFPNDDEVHGPFVAKDEADLRAQMRAAGLDPSKLRWERKND